jgi:hypothetical protein
MIPPPIRVILRARADLWGDLILKKTIREGIFFKVCA